MIKPSKDGTKLWFIPPEKSHEQELEFDLVYAHTCPKCNNLVQALFLTDKLISPKPWEEIFTKQTDKDGKYKRIIPGRHAKYHSRYAVIPIGRGNAVSAQLIRFTQHFDPKDDSNNQSICNYIAIASQIPEYRLHDMLLSLFPPLNPVQYVVTDSDYEVIKGKVLGTYPGPDQYLFDKGIGNGPELVFMMRKAQQWVLSMAMGSYFKCIVIPSIGGNA